MAETMMKMPALAVVGADHRIVRSTESFRKRYTAAQALCDRSPELEQVLTGRADTAVVSVGELSVEIEAVTDAEGRRQAMLSLPPVDRTSVPDAPVSALRDAAEESPAIVWVKDLEGRYLYANPRFLRDLDTSSERLVGNTDADLPETETVDGPRRRYTEDGLEEPLQLEYIVPAVDRRPELAAFRFALRDDQGQPIGTCGVATPVGEANLARDEAVRLMQLERWSRLDPSDVRAELLEQWHVQAAAARRGEADEAAYDETLAEGAQAVALPEPGAGAGSESAELLHAELQDAQAHLARVEAEAEELRAAMHGVTEEATRWRGEFERIKLELEQAEAESKTELEQARSQAQVELEQARAEAQAELEQAQAELGQARLEAQAELEQTQADARVSLEQAQADAQSARSELDAARAELSAMRAQAESLRGPSAAAMRLSGEIGRALAAERERGGELERALARIRMRLSDFETTLDRSPAHAARKAA